MAARPISRRLRQGDSSSLTEMMLDGRVGTSVLTSAALYAIVDVDRNRLAVLELVDADRAHVDAISRAIASVIVDFDDDAGLLALPLPHVH
jgi:hypothetical protein